jgi:hypothetical protein
MKKLVTTVALFVLAPTAGAFAGGGSPLLGYGGAGGAVQGAVQKSGSLPFTGLNLGLVALLAAGLLLAGFVLRRANRSS